MYSLLAHRPGFGGSSTLPDEGCCAMAKATKPLTIKSRSIFPCESFTVNSGKLTKN